jgi:precorrin-4/cobalt-precorrin-4 C11-methyltransferase
VTWEDETIVRGTLADISASARLAGFKRQALILVGRAIDPELRRAAAARRSNLYDPAWSHVFRLAEGRGEPTGPHASVAGGVRDSGQD